MNFGERFVGFDPARGEVLVSYVEVTRPARHHDQDRKNPLRPASPERATPMAGPASNQGVE